MTKIEIIIAYNAINFIRNQPKYFKLTIYTLLFNPLFPHENKIVLLEILLAILLVKICLYLFLTLFYMIKGVALVLINIDNLVDYVMNYILIRLKQRCLVFQ